MGPARMAAFAALAWLLIVLSAAIADQADLDPGFGAGGIVVTHAAASDTGGVLSIDNSGRYVVAGAATSGGQQVPVLVRHSSGGSPDTSFDGDGQLLLSTLPGATADALLARQIPANTGTPRIVVAGSQGTSWFVTRLSDDGTVDWTATYPLPVGTVSAHVGGFVMDATGLVTLAGWGDTSVGGAHGYLAQIDASSASAPAAPTFTAVDAGDGAATRLRAIADAGGDFFVTGTVKDGGITKAYAARRSAGLAAVWEKLRTIGSGGNAAGQAVEQVQGAGTGDAIVAGQAADAEVTKAFVARYAYADGAVSYERLLTAGDGTSTSAAAVRAGASTAMIAGSAGDGGSTRAMVDRILLSSGADDPAFVSGPGSGQSGPVLIGAGDGRSTAARDVALDGAQPVFAGTTTDGSSSGFVLGRLNATHQNPSATFTHTNTHSDLTDYAGEQLTFTASATPGTGASVTSYEWDFDGDGTFDATGSQPKHTYATAGTYLVELRVTDSNGVRAYASRQLTITTDPPPVMTALGVSPAHPANGGTVAVCPQGSDPKGYAVSYELDLDDNGTYETTWNGQGSCPTTTFDASGAKTATKTYHARAVDFVGTRSAPLDRTVQGATTPPEAGTVVVAKPVVAAGQPITFVASGFTDPDGVVVKWRFDLDGDGTWDTGFQDSPSYTTTFATARKAFVKAQGMDEDGQLSPATLGQGYLVVGPPAASFKVKVKKPVVSKGHARAGIHPLQALSFDGSASKPGAFAPYVAPIGFVTYTWDPQGDGSHISSSGPVLDTVVYKNPGVYAAKLTVCTASLVTQCTSATKNVTIVNQAPLADFGVLDGKQIKALKGKPFTVEAQRPVHLQTTLAKDPDGLPHRVVDFAWDLGANAGTARRAHAAAKAPSVPKGLLPSKAALSSKNVLAGLPVAAPGGGFTVQAKGPAPTVKFLQASAGEYHVRLRETDDSGGVTIVSHPVKVLPSKAPEASVSLSISYSQDALGVPILRPGKGYLAVVDAKASPGASKPTLTYDWGDLPCGKAQVNCGVSFAQPGYHDIAVTVTDADGLSTVAHLPVLVRENTPPYGTVAVTPAYPREGDPIHLDATGSFDDGKYFTLSWGLNDSGFQPIGLDGFGADVDLTQGHHDLALKLTDDENATTTVPIPIDVGPPACHASYASDHLTVGVVDGSDGCIQEHNGLGAATNKPETLVDIKGPFTVDGLRIDPQGTAQIRDFHNATANDKVAEKVGNAYKPGDKLPIIVTGTGKISRGSFVVSDGAFAFAIRSDGGVDFLGYQPATSQKLHGLAIVGISSPQVDASGAIDFGLLMQLPAAVGGTTSDPTPFAVWEAQSAGGARRRALLRDTQSACEGIPNVPPDATCFTVDGGELAGGAIALKKLQVGYGGNDVWIVRAEADVPIGPKGAVVSGGLRFEQGAFTHADGAIDFNAPGFPIDQLEIVNLSHIDFAIDTGSSTDFAGNAIFVVGPKFDDSGDALYGLNAGIKFHFPDQGYWTISASGTATMLGKQIADGNFVYSSSGYVGFGGSFHYAPIPDVSYDAHLGGAYYNGDFNISGGGQGCVLGWCEGGEGVVSSKGIGVCIEVTVDYLAGTATWSPGFTVAYHPFDLNLFAHACDLSDVTVSIVQPTRRRSAFLRGAPDDSAVYAHAAGFTKTFTIDHPVPGAVVAVVGSVAPPRVTLQGPKNTVIDGTPGETVIKPKAYSLLHDPATKTTYVVLLGPAQGKWKLSVPDGSSPVVSATMTEGLAQPSIDTKVTGSGQARKLAYKVAPQPGLKVEFLEQAGRAFSSIGTVKPGKGTIPFTPAAGPAGNRKIVAVLYSGNRPRGRSTVGSYVAPAPPRPEDASGVKVTLKGGKAVVTWDKSARTSRYRVEIRLSDGRFVADTVSTPGYTVAGVGRGVTVKAAVTPVSAQDLPGTVDRAKAATPRLPAKIRLDLKRTAKKATGPDVVPPPALTLLPSTQVKLGS